MRYVIVPGIDHSDDAHWQFRPEGGLLSGGSIVLRGGAHDRARTSASVLGGWDTGRNLMTASVAAFLGARAALHGR